jgi:hypothetical protein
MCSKYSSNVPRHQPQHSIVHSEVIQVPTGEDVSREQERELYDVAESP